MSKAKDWEVESVVGHRRNEKGELQYRLKWKGFPKSENSWEPESHLKCPILQEIYWKSLLKLKSNFTIVGGGRTSDDRLVWAVRLADGETVLYENAFLRKHYPDRLIEWYVDKILPRGTVDCTIAGAEAGG
jgi:hypothetical protein